MGSAFDEATAVPNIKEVAVIGAGFSGITSAAHLLRYGLRVTVFERSSVAGGVWCFDPRCAHEPLYPNERPPAPSNCLTPAAVPNQRLSFDEVSLSHAPPGPCYAGLRNNVPTTLMKSTLMPWPEDTDEIVSHEDIEKYIQTLARRSGVQSHIFYDTRVNAIWKAPVSGKWSIQTTTLCKTDGSRSDHELVGTQWDFDAVVVASGHYNEPRIPSVAGLREWKDRWPEMVTHSKRYREAEGYQEKTVLLIGAGVSSLDIAKEITGVAKKVYQSARGGRYDLPTSLLPESVERIGEVESFVMPDPTSLHDHERKILGGKVVLKGGRTITDIDRVIVATGYITSYEFLGDLQSPSCPAEDAGDRVIVTSDGCITHNLHKDIFYIPDPTLAFVGVPYHVSTFSLFDFQAEVVARVFSGQAKLPSQGVMREEYSSRWEEKGGSREFHSLMAKDLVYMDEILGWLNADAQRLRHVPMSGVDDRWRRRYTDFLAEMQKRRIGQPIREAHVDGKSRG